MQLNPLASDLEHIFAHTRDLWESLREQRIFISGGTGFFGRWLLESFAFADQALDLRAQVAVLTRSRASFLQKAPQFEGNSWVELIEGDIRDFEFPTGPFSHVIHAATQTNSLTTPLEPAALFEANVSGTRRMVEFAAAARAQKLLFTSSGAVYGPQPSHITHLPEESASAPSPLDSNTAYGQSKRVSEFICAVHGQKAGFDAMIARCFAFVGPYLSLDANYAIGNFIRDALRGEPIKIEGDGTPYRSYLYAADLVIWLWTILFRGRGGTAYNVGSDADLTIAELARTVANIVNPDATISIAHVADPKRRAQRYVPAIKKARAELGLKPWIDLSEAIRRTANWNENLHDKAF